MISEKEIAEKLMARFSDWNINTRQSGVAFWVNLNDGSSNYFELQVTPDQGVGVSVIESDASDMAGHDEVFDSFDSAVDYLEQVILSK